MALADLSKDYASAADLLRKRLRLLRQLLAQATDPDDIFHLKRRIAELTPMLTQMNELAELTAHYYDRGYYRNEKYTVGWLSRSTTLPGSTAGPGAAGDPGSFVPGSERNPGCLLFSPPVHYGNRSGSRRT